MSRENSSQIEAAETVVAEVNVPDIALAIEKIENSKSAEPEISGDELRQRMCLYGENSAACQASEQHFQKHYYQGVVALALASLFAMSGVWSLITMVLALFATWRIVRCFSIDSHCERLETATRIAHEELEEALALDSLRQMFPTLYKELKDHTAKRQLAWYLPGPIEVGRRSAQWQPLGMLTL